MRSVGKKKGQHHYSRFTLTSVFNSFIIMEVNNNTNLFVQLPHTLLTRITNELRDNIDKICFSLVCKRWFDERDRYLLFNIDNHIKQRYLNDDDCSSLFFTKSYKSIYIKSLEISKNNKNNCILYIGDLNEYQRRDYYDRIKNPIIEFDYFIDYKLLNTIDKIPSNVTNVLLNIFNKLNQDDSKHLYKLLAESNVTQLDGCNTVVHQLPPRLVKLTFDNQFNESLSVGCFPSTLKEITFGEYFSQPIHKGVFLEGLEKLALGANFCETIENSANVFPSTLEYLSVGSYYDAPHVNMFPPNLEILEYTAYNRESIDGMLPATLHTIIDIPYQWISHIGNLPNLKHLVSVNNEDVNDYDNNDEYSAKPFDLISIPEGIETLIIGDTEYDFLDNVYTVYRLSGALPNSVETFNTGPSYYQFDTLFPSDIQYHFKELALSTPGDTKPIPSNIKAKKLCLSNYHKRVFNEGDLPDGIEILEFRYCKQIEFKSERSLPDSIKEIIVYNQTLNDLQIPSGMNSSSLECITYINDCKLSMKKGVKIPESIRTLNTVFDATNFQYIPTTLTNINFTNSIESVSNNIDCQVRKLDSKYYLMFGTTNRINCISTIFNQSMFNSSLVEKIESRSNQIKKLSETAISCGKIDKQYFIDHIFNYNYLMNNNSTNKFVNLPHTLLTRIINELDENIDRICFSLVCKRWFDERNRYLSFKTDIKYDKSRWYLRSYQSIIENSNNSKKIFTLLIGEKLESNALLDLIDPNDFDFHSECGTELLSHVDIPSGVTSVTLNVFDTISEEESSHLFRLLREQSNVTELNGLHTVAYQLPSSLKSISFDPQFNEPLTVGSLPAGLKIIQLEGYDGTIESGAFPDGVEEINLQSYSKPLGYGVLPNSVKSLKYAGRHPIGVGVLPQNLETLTYSGYQCELEDGVLPSSLTSLIMAPSQWIPKLKSHHLPNLNYLNVYDSRGETNEDGEDFVNGEKTIDLSEIPATVRNLCFYYTYTLRSALSTSITHLNIDRCRFRFTEILPEDNQYNFQDLTIGYRSEQQPFPKNVQTLQLHLHDYNQSIKCGELPFGIELLEFCGVMSYNIERGALPNSIKKLNLYNRCIKDINNEGVIPDSVESIGLCHIGVYERYSDVVVPPTIRNLSTNINKITRCKIAPNTLTNLELNCNFNPKPIIQIRKLDNHHYLVIGKSNPFKFIAAMFHESLFLEEIFRVIVETNPKPKSKSYCRII
ncbi:hypothetical protein PPL_06344 [Heterostelium album PN500]|uniref:Uncharacterized protein n=1 Tax=Heterostelium pallidum (strain ATCC 26659 / Pp 5 / PN500) TaxID=670386 RepID=D3BCW6_HETP5|nr:hypothetical protein PPL_06344 [Heterostelium album PN500]EFA80758.1 hypothetical protein PPL_06344 [Heterostelium album PN500]|eukprot:XP_020432877.1 hypothetical protein PPL_06344 [Heterostelium album PN500]